MTQKPLISITTPCYNSAATIERTIKSILAQDFKDYEYIIVDGGSTDGTLDIIRKYEPLFEGRMKWRSEPDRGLYDAFNKGIERSTGIYCWNVNSDDFLEPEALNIISSTVKSMLEKNLVISFGMNFRNYEGDKILRVQHTNAQKCKKCFEKDAMGIPHPATIVARNVYDTIGSYCSDFKIIGDIDWFHRAYARQDVSFIFRDEIITNMCDGGISNVFDFKKSSKDRKLFLKRKYTNPIRRWFSYLKWVKLFYSQKKIHERKVS